MSFGIHRGIGIFILTIGDLGAHAVGMLIIHAFITITPIVTAPLRVITFVRATPIAHTARKAPHSLK